MTLIFKSDATYTGVAQARSILELLTSASEKTFFIKKMLSDIGAESDYVTDATSANIVDRLLSHTKRVAKLGAQVLSVNRTLKAIVFVMKHELLDTDYVAFSPDFGVRLDANGYMLSMYGLGIPKELITISGGAPTVEKTEMGYNGITITTPRLSSVTLSTIKMTLTKGLILGNCLEQDAVTTVTPLSLRLSSSFNSILGTSIAYGRIASASSVSMGMPTTSATTKSYNKQVSTGVSGAYNNAGVVAKYEYGTVNNKLFMNGDVLINNSETATMFDLSTTVINLSIFIDVAAQIKIMESWVINSKSEPLALALSNHLNRA